MIERIVILGGGESGVGAALLAQAKGLDIFLSDSSPLTEDRRTVLIQKGIDFEEGQHTESKIFNATTVVKSPGIPDKAPLIKQLNERGISVISEIEFGYRYLPEGAKVIAITGTNGKTTTTLLIYHLLKEAGVSVALGGNVGTSLAGLIANGSHDFYVIEVSSFQLDGIETFKPDVAILLNITPDHLDRYEYDMSKYVASKFLITKNLNASDTFIYSSDSAPIVEVLNNKKIDAQMINVSVESANADGYVEKNNLNLNEGAIQLPIKDLPLIGKHNMTNIMSSVFAAQRVGISIENIQAGLKTFVNAPHRLEPVGELDGVKYINDSKATNVDAVYYALDGIKADIQWIVGGVDKGNKYGQVMDLVKEKVKGIICMGTDNSPVLNAFSSTNIPIAETRSVNEAIAKAQDWALPGQVVLLSPACASFDLFKNFEDRGNQFRAAVQSLVQNQHA
jgi:UDP-N-acetylmuramoylalanine--D-glutamate ligase